MDREEQTNTVEDAANAENEVRDGSRSGHNLTERAADGGERKRKAGAALVAARGRRAYERPTGGTKARTPLLFL